MTQSNDSFASALVEAVDRELRREEGVPAIERISSSLDDETAWIHVVFRSPGEQPRLMGWSYDMPLAWMTRPDTDAAGDDLPSMVWIAVDVNIEFLDVYYSAWNRRDLVDDGSVLWIRDD